MLRRHATFLAEPIVALHAAAPADAIAALAIALNAEGQAPEWIHLLPPGKIETADGRGPYNVDQAATLASDSLKAAGGRLLIDENHATDLAAPNGQSAPARGWIVELQARADGIWGKVEWTKDGGELVTSRAYRHISPAFMHRKDGTITRILRAALVNAPNLRGLAALNQQQENASMKELLKALCAALGLAEDADQDKVLAAIKSLKDGATTSLQSVAKAVGLKDDADEKTVLAAVEKAVTGAKAKEAGDDKTVAALQAELGTVTTKFNTLSETIAKDKAEAFVDGAIKQGKVGVKPLRDHYIARHMKDPATVEKEIGSFSTLGPSGALTTPPADKDGAVSLSAEQKNAAKALGIPEDKYLATFKAERAKEEVN